MSPKQFLIATVLLVCAVAGVAYAANWTPYVPTNSALVGATWVQVYPPAKGTTQTFAPIGALPSYTIGGLPACGASTQGSRAYVTNGATSPTYLGTVSATGAVIVPVFCNGTSWLYD